MDIKKITAAFRGYAIALLLIIIGFAIFLLYVSYNSSDISVYKLINKSPKSASTDFSIDISVNKEWIDDELHPQMSIGAQYAAIITNHSQKTLRDWQLEIELPQGFVLDSFWNGNYKIEDNKIIITPLDNNKQIQPNDSISFGYVLYSNKLLKFQTASLSGSQIINHTSPIFWIFIAAFFVWLVIFMIHVFTYMSSRKFLRRQVRDSAIILQSMNTFASFIDAKDPYTQGHSTRVAIYAGEIARRMKLSPEEINTLYYIALMHDCGKIGIPDAILNKPDILTEQERKMIQSHTKVGGNILKNFTAIPGIRDGALYHHERFDGKGYPTGLKGLEIPLYARIICIADSYDAMSSRRCYRKPFDKERTIKELLDNAGKQFDPDLVRYMIDMIQDGFVNLVHTGTHKDLGGAGLTESSIVASAI